jgi:hypothetical protein
MTIAKPKICQSHSESGLRGRAAAPKGISTGAIATPSLMSEFVGAVNPKSELAEKQKFVALRRLVQPELQFNRDTRGGCRGLHRRW